MRCVRAWDFAGTEVKKFGSNDPDYTVGALIGEQGGQYWILDVQRARISPKGVEALVLQTAQMDGISVEILIEQEPGSAGIAVIEDYRRRVLRGYAVHGIRHTGSKFERARPAASAAEAGNILLVEGPWITPFLETVCQFPFGKHDDDVDVLSMGINYLGRIEGVPQMTFAPAFDTFFQPSHWGRL